MTFISFHLNRFTRPFLRLAALACLVTLTGCATHYLDGAVKDVARSEFVRPPQAHPVQLLVEFQTNGAANARGSQEVRPMVAEAVKASGLFTDVEDKPVAGGAVLSVEINNVALLDDAFKKGFMTGLTFGIAGNTVTDGYQCALAACMAGCAQLELGPPVASFDNMQQARATGMPPVALGRFVPAPSLPSGADQRLVARTNTIFAPANSFSQYLREALRADLDAAGLLDAASPFVLEGTLTENVLHVPSGLASGAVAARIVLSRNGRVVYEKEFRASAQWHASFPAVEAVPSAINQTAFCIAASSPSCSPTRSSAQRFARS